MIPALLGALRFAPAVLSAGREIAGALSGREMPPAATAEEVADRIDAMPEAERRAALSHVLAARVRCQELDTARFTSLTEGGADKVRATARPEIALRAMRVVSLLGRGLTLLVLATVGEWAVRMAYAVLGAGEPELPSIWALIAEAEPLAEMIWAPLVATIAASTSIVRKYMGCRERDKSREDEIRAGRPLDAGQATIADAGGAIAGLVRAFRGGRP